jgi:phenylacetate-CoA ligase
VAPSAIEEVVRSVKGLSNEFEVVVTKKGDLDDITLKIEFYRKRKKSRGDPRPAERSIEIEDQPWLQH